MVIRNKSIIENDFIEIMLAAHLIDRIDLDAVGLHVHQKLRKTMAPVLIGRRRRTKQCDHVIGNMRITCPDLAAVNTPAFVDLRCLGFDRK